MTSNGDEKATPAPPKRPDKPVEVEERGWNLVDNTPPAPVDEVPLKPPAPPPPTTPPSTQGDGGSGGSEE